MLLAAQKNKEQVEKWKIMTRKSKKWLRLPCQRKAHRPML